MATTRKYIGPNSAIWHGPRRMDLREWKPEDVERNLQIWPDLAHHFEPGEPEKKAPEKPGKDS